MKPVHILVGDCRERLRDLPPKLIHTCITSPPYFGLRDYDHPDQIGLEPSYQVYVDRMVDVFREIRRVLRDDGTVWLVLGDSYNAADRRGHGSRVGFKQNSNRASARGADLSRPNAPDLKPKDLIGIPWRVAFALQADGWYLRQDIIWAKPNPMPEPVKDRCTKAHEYVFLLAKSNRYAFDSEAMAEASVADHSSGNGFAGRQGGSRGLPMSGGRGTAAEWRQGGGRNKRSVWTVAPEPVPEAHFATFPPALIEPCILAGAPPGGVVLDPFGGAGTTGMVAARLGRRAILIELNPGYAALARRRIDEGGRP